MNKCLNWLHLLVEAWGKKSDGSPEVWRNKQAWPKLKWLLNWSSSSAFPYFVGGHANPAIPPCHLLCHPLLFFLSWQFSRSSVRRRGCDSWKESNWSRTAAAITSTSILTTIIFGSITREGKPPPLHLLVHTPRQWTRRGWDRWRTRVAVGGVGFRSLPASSLPLLAHHLMQLLHLASWVGWPWAGVNKKKKQSVFENCWVLRMSFEKQSLGQEELELSPQ